MRYSASFKELLFLLIGVAAISSFGCATRIDIPTATSSDLAWARVAIGTTTKAEIEKDQNDRYAEIVYEEALRRRSSTTDSAAVSITHPAVRSYRNELVRNFKRSLGFSPSELSRRSPKLYRSASAKASTYEQRANLQRAATVIEENQRALSNRLEAVGRRLVAAADRSSMKIEPVPGVFNAFAPHGFDTNEIFVGTEMVLFARSDDELACVVGHEVAHVTEGHTEAGAWVDLGKKVVKTGVAVTLGAIAAYGGQPLTGSEIQGAVDAGNLTAFLLGDVPFRVSGWGRGQEDEADAIGTYYTWRAGYDPYACVTFFGRMYKRAEAEGEKSGVSWWRTHPLALERFVRVSKIVEKMRDGTLVVQPLRE